MLPIGLGADSLTKQLRRFLQSVLCWTLLGSPPLALPPSLRPRGSRIFRSRSDLRHLGRKTAKTSRTLLLLARRHLQGTLLGRVDKNKLPTPRADPFGRSRKSCSDLHVQPVQAA